MAVYLSFQISPFKALCTLLRPWIPVQALLMLLSHRGEQRVRWGQRPPCLHDNHFSP